MKTTIIEMTGGSLGGEKMRLRCQLSQAAAPIMVDYGNGEGWQHTQYQCADARHTVNGMVRIGQLLADAYTPLDDLAACEWREVDD